jgi:drug/metabolite transporter (DMT)-like permease
MTRLVVLTSLAVTSLAIVLRVGVELGVLLVHDAMPAAAWLGLLLVSLSVVLIATSAALLLSAPQPPRVRREARTVAIRRKARS